MAELIAQTAANYFSQMENNATANKELSDATTVTTTNNELVK
jgi:hypothetical protein